MLCAAFAETLAARRQHCNAAVAAARRAWPGFDQHAFGRFLTEQADPVVAAVAALAPQRVAAVVDASVEIGIELTGRRLLDAGPRGLALAQAWSGLAPCCAVQVAQSPGQVLGMLSNASLHLAALPGVSTARWQADMGALAPRALTLAELRALGQVLAWRAGAAHFRQGALAALDALPPALALAAVRASASGDWGQVRAALRDDPWWRAPQDEQAASQRIVGAFAGLGGAFTAPPLLRAAGAHAGGASFVVRSGEHDFALHADAHGAIVLPARTAMFDAAPDGAGDGGARAALDWQRVAPPFPAQDCAVCAGATTIAIASPYSHAILLVARAWSAA
ncbi:hypothetical protein LE190_06640 [Massilia oculi]|uniref:Uncharacterized protein n=1 Tax=Massilia hydrophila TaxID=3044279 RepID=A0ABS7Y7E9_9BURK|nr:hypothetical protein [Massilia oculi]MCA1855603.1 hypothetical protein [Massilia oculi]